MTEAMGEQPADRVLVTGATGGVGRALLPVLLEKGFQITALARRHGTEWLRELGVPVIRGNVSDAETLRSATENVDIVIHLAGLLRGHPSELYTVNAAGTENLMKACKDRSVKRIVYPSSLVVPGPGGHVPTPEDAPCTPNTHYGRSKLRAEDALLSAWRDWGLPAVILRCGLIITDSSRVLRWMVPWLKWRLPLISIANLVHLVHVHDVVQAILSALNPQVPGGQIYNIGDGKPVTGNELMRALAEAASAPEPRHVPLRVTKRVIGVGERLARLIGTRPPLTSDMLEVALTNHAGEIGKAKTVLGYEPNHPAVVDELSDVLRNTSS